MLDELTDAYLAAVDLALPGYVRGLYLVGSASLGAWQSGVSDVDTVILTARAATGEDLAALADIHAAMPSSPHLDGVYLEPALAALWPDDRRVVPFVVNGEFHSDRACGELSPVLWLTLRRYGIAVRGPAVAELGVRVDLHALREYNLGNLRDYWQAEAATVVPYVAAVEPDAPVHAEGVTWLVLGPARLHYTLAHEDVIDKAAAGRYLAGLFPEYADLVRRAVRWRVDQRERFTAADLTPAAASVDAVVADAWRRFAR